MSVEYLYYAFISYKREDSKYAKWLQKKLQSYRLPAKIKREDVAKKISLGGDGEVPARLSPVFRDKTDLIPGKLGDSIENSIARSKYLIVLCSRAANASSNYIDMEIRKFIDSGHSPEQIIPLIVDTESTAPEKECFPSALREINERHELLGANIGDSGKNDAFLKIVANMLGVQMAEIKNLDNIRRRKNAAVGALAGIAAAVLAACGVSYWWNNIALHTEYYLGYVVEHNAARGLSQIKNSDSNSYNRCYKFMRIADRVQSVEYINAAGRLVPADANVFNEGAARIEYTYSDSGSLYMARFYDENNRLLFCQQYSADGTHVTLLKDSETGETGYAIEDVSDIGGGGIDRTNVSRYVQGLDENGRIKQRLFAYGDEYTIYSNGASLYGYGFEYDNEGRLTRLSYIGNADGTRLTDVGGAYAVEYEYSGDEVNPSVKRFLSSDGSLINGEDGWAYSETEWNSINGRSKVSYFDQDGAPVLCAEGYSSLTRDYSGAYCVSESYFNTAGELAPPEAKGYATETYKQDEKGRTILCRYFSADGSPAKDKKTGTYGYTWEFGDGERTRTYINEAGEPMLSSDGYAISKVIENEYSYPLANYYYDAEGKPATEHYASCTYKYDDNYNITEWSFFDENGKPKMFKIGVTSAAAFVSEYDNKGNETFYAFLDAEGGYLEGNDGWAKTEFEYDQIGKSIVETQMFYDKNGDPTENTVIGACGVETMRDEAGRLVSIFSIGSAGTYCYNEEDG